jgi:hypothetical protein
MLTISPMKKPTVTRQVNADVPEALGNEFDELIERLGMTKKRAVAAALLAFLVAERAAQFSVYQDVYERYYAGKTGDEGEEGEGGGSLAKLPPKSPTPTAPGADVAAAASHLNRLADEAEKAHRKKRPGG